MFSLYEPSNGSQRPVEFAVIKNNSTIKVGDAIVNDPNGVSAANATSDLIDGAAVSILTRNKVSLESASVDTSLYTGTWTASTKSYTASATNADSGGDGVLVAYVPAFEGDKWKGTLSGAKGTTTGSNLKGYFLSINTSNASQLLETSASSSKASCQFRIADPLLSGSTTEVIVEIIARGLNQASVV